MSDSEVKKLRDALILARMALEQRQSLDGCICANGPTIREVIAEALKISKPA